MEVLLYNCDGSWMFTKLMPYGCFLMNPTLEVGKMALIYTGEVISVCSR
jgi:hypothetical protein